MNKVPKKINLGCGLKAPQGWINLDGSWNARLAKHPRIRKLIQKLRLFPKSQFNINWPNNIFIHDVRRSLPFASDSIDCIYSSHLLEHLYLEEGKRLLKESFRILIPGGVLRIVVPDLYIMTVEYQKQISQNAVRDLFAPGENPADRLNMNMLFHMSNSPSGNILYRFYTFLNDFHTHKWMYDVQSLITYIRWAGFIDVAERQYLDSRIDDISVIEDPGRLLNNAGICVEGIKP